MFILSLHRSVHGAPQSLVSLQQLLEIQIRNGERWMREWRGGDEGMEREREMKAQREGDEGMERGR